MAKTDDKDDSIIKEGQRREDKRKDKDGWQRQRIIKKIVKQNKRTKKKRQDMDYWCDWYRKENEICREDERR